MSSHQTVFPINAVADAELTARSRVPGKSVTRPLFGQFALLLLSAFALFGGLPLWLDVLVEQMPALNAGDWGVFRFVVLGGVVGALLLGVIVANTWITLVKRLARTDWEA